MSEEKKEVAMVPHKQTRVDLMNAISPEATIDIASKQADILKNIIEQKGLARQFGKGAKKHVDVEGWQTAGMLNGVTAKCLPDRVIRLTDKNGNFIGFEAYAEAIRISDGMILGGQKAYCMTDEPNWKNRPTYAIASMAQTRAISKTLRSIFSWIMVLAGYDPTPAEEMDGIHQEFNSKPPPEPASGAPLSDEMNASFDNAIEDVWDEANEIKPQSKSQPVAVRGDPDKISSEKQRKMIWAVAKSKGVSDDLKDITKKMTGKEHSKDLTNGDIQKLKNYLDSL